MAERIQIEIEAQDFASGVLRGLMSQFGQVGQVAMDFGNALSSVSGFLGMVKDAINGADISLEDLDKAQIQSYASMARLGEQLAILAYQTLKDAVNVTVEYAGQVRELSQITGRSAEESSKLIQVSDDLKVSYDSIKAAMRAMTKEGISPSIESMAQLSDQYRAIQDPVMRSEFLLKNFGRAGLDMAEMMSKGGDAIRKMGGSVESSLIMTQKGVDRAREYEIALDNWNDAVMGAKISMGTELLPALTAVMTEEYGMTRAQELATEAGKNFMALTQAQKMAFIEKARAELDAAKATTDAAAATQDHWMKEKEMPAALQMTTEQLQAQQDALKAHSDALKGEMDLMFSLQGAADSYNQTLQTQTDKRNDILAKMAELQAAGQTESDQYVNLQGQLGEVNAALDQNAAKYQEATNKIIFSLMEQKMSADGLSDEEFSALLQIAEGFGMIDEKSAAAADAVMKSLDDMTPANAAEKAQAANQIIADSFGQMGTQSGTASTSVTTNSDAMSTSVTTNATKVQTATKTQSDAMNTAYKSIDPSVVTANVNEMVTAVNETTAMLDPAPIYAFYDAWNKLALYDPKSLAFSVTYTQTGQPPAQQQQQQQQQNGGAPNMTASGQTNQFYNCPITLMVGEGIESIYEVR